MNKDIEALVDGCNLPYVIPLLNDLENAIHEHSFDNGYETGYDIEWENGKNIFTTKGGRLRNPDADPSNELEVEYNPNNDEVSPCFHCNI